MIESLMLESSNSNDLLNVVILLGAAVVVVPFFKRIGMGSIIGYLFAGFLIGPFGLQIFRDPHSILHVAELGVVMFLFVIGLEMKPSHLWKMRGDIFGLGSFQIILCTFVLTCVGMGFGFSPVVSFIAGMGFVLTSTAVVMQLLSENGEVGLPHGQKMVAILLFEDLLIVPLLAIVVILSPVHTSSEGTPLYTLLTASGALLGLSIVGVWFLNPFFSFLANSKAREVLTAAALFVVLGAALLMQVSGLSMAMGAFLAGVLLSESSFRHQIEADIEPFRGILLGLFFIGVGMSLDLNVVLNNLGLIFGGVFTFMIGKALCIYIVARQLKSSPRESLERALVMAQGGEFAFVLYTAALQAKVITSEINANMTAIVVLSMVLTPIVVALASQWVPPLTPSTDGVDDARDLEGVALLIGFGRFGQVVSQLLLARDIDVTIIDTDPEGIKSAQEFGVKIYYGDGTRLDVLHASGAHKAKFVAVCIDNKEEANKIVHLLKSEFPQTKILVRSYDRVHARELVLEGVDFQIRETFESAILFGQEALRQIEVPENDVQAIAEDIRARDKERFEREIVSNNTKAGRDLLLGNIPKPQPLIEPKRKTKILNPDQ